MDPEDPPESTDAQQLPDSSETGGPARRKRGFDTDVAISRAALLTD